MVELASPYRIAFVRIAHSFLKDSVWSSHFPVGSFEFFKLEVRGRIDCERTTMCKHMVLSYRAKAVS